MFDRRPERLRGFPKVWVDLACVVDDARSRPTWVNPRGYDMSLIVPGLLLMRLATAHGRELAVVETRLLRADGRPPGLRVTLLVPSHAVTPRLDQPARPEHNEGPAT